MPQDETQEVKNHFNSMIANRIQAVTQKYEQDTDSLHYSRVDAHSKAKAHLNGLFAEISKGAYSATAAGSVPPSDSWLALEQAIHAVRMTYDILKQSEKVRTDLKSDLERMLLK